jgi:peroxiredoxin
MRELLPQLELEDKGLLTISVVEPGALSLAPVKEPLDAPNVHLAWAEDFEGGWARAFEAREGRPAFLVIPPDGLVWRSSAEPEAGELAEALGRYMKAAQLPASRKLRPAVREYERAPDFLFDYIPGMRMKLRTLRGRPVHINFFKSWSQPCLIELRRLHALQERQGERVGVILAVADGQDGQEAQALFERHGYGFRIVADPDRRIARQYGIVAWPTTITVDAGGFVRAIRSGASTVADTSGDYQAYQAE